MLAAHAVWIASSVLGLFYNFLLLRRAFGDLKYLQANNINSTREGFAQLSVVTYTTLTMVQAIFVIVGVISIISAGGLHEDSLSGKGIEHLAIVIGFLFVSILLALVAMITEKRRQKLIEMLEGVDFGR